MEDLRDRAELTAALLKKILKSNGLYLGVSAKNKEFIFIDRESYDKGVSKGNFVRIKMDDVNIKSEV